MKKCKKCKETKEITKFYKDKTKKDGLQPRCKSCVTVIVKIYRQNNKDKTKEYYKTWYSLKQGIYSIFAGSICLYVGESKQLLSRIYHHRAYIKNPAIAPKNYKYFYENINNDYPNWEIKIIEETPNHKEREIYWINKLKPKFNIKCNK